MKNRNIRLGEIVGYRLWVVRGARLHSYAADYVWTSGVNGPADVDEAGFHAYKTIEDAVNHHPRSSGRRQLGALVTGKILMWGDVVEHEYGYRAQYAKVVELMPMTLAASKPKTEREQEVLERYMAVWNQRMTALREHYGVG
jgi:hypothetical protein